MMVNPMELFRLKAIWDRLCQAHPKLVPFLRSVYPAAFGEGSIVDIKVTDPSGKVYHYNMRLSAEDMEAFHAASAFGQDMTQDVTRDQT